MAEGVADRHSTRRPVARGDGWSAGEGWPAADPSPATPASVADAAVRVWFGRSGYRFAAASIARVEALAPRAGPGGGLTGARIARAHGALCPGSAKKILRGLALAGRVVAEDGPAGRLYRRPLHGEAAAAGDTSIA